MKYCVSFKYKGNIYKKNFYAKNKAHLESKLKNYIVLEIIEVKEFLDIFLKKPTNKELLFAFYAFKLGLKAHLALPKILENLQNTTKNKILKKQFISVYNSLQSGKSLKESFKVANFNPFITQMLGVGQRTNLLLESIEFIINNLKNTEKNQKLLSKVMLYPCIVSVIMILVFLGITLFVLPQFEVLFSSLNISLPFISQSLLFMRKMVLDYGILSLSFLIIFSIFTISFYKKSFTFKSKIDSILLKIPFLKSVLYYYSLLQFLQSFFWLYSSKVPLSEALEISTQNLNNASLIKKAKNIYPLILQGISIKNAFKNIKLLDSISIQLLDSTQNEASFIETLEILTELYEEELNTHSSRLLACVEPFMILILGILVLWLALGIFLPLWEMPMQMGAI
ncbi:MAG: type II secretion system F family protein [Helicobacter sp.]|nr:type II secretion system F family protein [Helicobacteraceae bacterium]MDY3113823.1 type II secretion system F family protein [Helicobacter sp.]